MKKFIIIFILTSFCFSTTNFSPLSSEVYAKETAVSGCKIIKATKEGSKEGKEFVDFILNKENLDPDSDTISIEYYEDGTASVTSVLANGDAVIFNSLTKYQAKEIFEYQETNSNNNDDERSLVSESIFWAIIQVYNIVKKAGKVVSYACKIAQMTGNGNPCAHLTDQIIQGLINSTQAKYEVSQYIYKDPACPYPINSLQCSQPPYAYTKTYLTRVN